MEENVEITYNNSKYILVDSTEIEEKEIYHFMSYKMIDFLIDDKNMPSINEHNIPVFSLFCTKENDSYIPIKNKKEEKRLLEEFGVAFENIIPRASTSALKEAFIRGFFDEYSDYIIKPETITGTDREKFIQEQKENYRKIKQKLGLNIDLTRIENKLNKMKINICNGEMPRDVRAFYSPTNNDINFKKEDIESEELGRRVRLHETNHYIAGITYSFANMFSKGILEGANENLVTDFFDNNTSSFCNYFATKYEKRLRTTPYEEAQVQYNFMQETAYPHLVSLVKQLEYITGVKSYESSINGDNHFIKAIVKELGIIPTIKLCAVTNTMVLPRTKGIEFLQKIEMLQNMIMQVSFDKQFDQIQSVQDAQVYLQRLREFEKYRGKITYLTRAGEIIKDNEYKNYYQSKLAQIQTRFKEKADLFDKYRYQEQEFKPLLSEGDDQVKAEISKRLMTIILSKNNGDAGKMPRQMNIEMFSKGDNWLVYKIDGQALEKPQCNIGRRNRLLLSSMYLKNKQGKKSRIEIHKELMQIIGSKRREMQIEYTEEEIERKCKEIKENIEKAEKEITRMMKKPTLIDKIKQKIFEFKTKRTIKEDKMKETKAKQNDIRANKPSWDLSNWRQDEIPERKAGEPRKETKKKDDCDIDME